MIDRLRFSLFRPLIFSAAFLVSVPSMLSAQNICAIFNPSGVVNPKLENQCGRFVTVEVVDTNISGNVISKRTFHLGVGEKRQVRFPSYSSTVTSVHDWSAGDHCDDGSSKLQLRWKEIDGTTLFAVRNLDAGRHLAYEFLVKSNAETTPRIETTLFVLPPGGRNDRQYGEATVNHPRLLLKWACLDPE